MSVALGERLERAGKTAPGPRLRGYSQPFRMNSMIE